MGIDCAFRIESIFVIFNSFFPIIYERNSEKAELLLVNRIAKIFENGCVPFDFCLWLEVINVKHVNAEKNKRKHPVQDHSYKDVD